MSLKLRVIEAKELLAADINARSDPYAVVSVSGVDEKKQTKVVENSLSPTWDEELSFCLPSPADAVLSVDVMDMDIAQSDLLGSVSIKLGDMQHGKLIDQWFELKNKGMLEKLSAGQVHLSFTISAEREEKEEQPVKEALREEEEEAEAPKVEEEEEGKNDENGGKEEAKKAKEEKNLRMLKERIEIHHQRYIAIIKGKEPPALQTKSIAQSPKTKPSAQKDAASQANGEEEEEEDKEEKEQLKKEVEEIKKLAMKRYEGILQKMPDLSDNKNKLEKQKVQRSYDEGDDLQKMSVQKLNGIYFRLIKENKDLEKEIAMLQKQIEA